MRFRDLQRLMLSGTLAILVGGVFVVDAQRSTDQRQPAPPVKTLPPANKAFDQFKDQLQKYLALRTRVEANVPKLTGTMTPKQVSDREVKLGDAIRDARKDIKQGDIFTPDVSKEFRRILAEDAAKRSPKAKEDIMEEVPEQPPVINAQYPTDSPKGPAALASFPPGLLAKLPVLPDTIEYRYLGKSLILRDQKANIIIDYLPAVAPTAARGGGR